MVFELKKNSLLYQGENQMSWPIILNKLQK